ncbi:MAG: phosphoglycerate mutase family protein [Nannocystaceae bacterium]
MPSTRRHLLAWFATAPLLACRPGPSTTPGEPVTTVYLVRHAEKQTGPDADPKDPSLTVEGLARARQLPKELADAQLVAIVSSPLERTRQTVAPVAERTGLAILDVAPTDIEGILAEVAKAEGQAVLISGHSNTVPSILAALGVEPAVTLSEGDYGDLFVVTIRGSTATLERRRFGDPCTACQRGG